MGCGGSVAGSAIAEELQASEKDLEEQKKRLAEKDRQIKGIRDRLQEVERQESAARASSNVSVDQLKSELQARHDAHVRALGQQKREFEVSFEQEFRARLQERDAMLQAKIDRHNAVVQEDIQAKRSIVEQSHRAKLHHMQETAEARAARHKSEAADAEIELLKLHEQCAILRGERDQAAGLLREAREMLRGEQHAAAANATQWQTPRSTPSSGSGRSLATRRRFQETQDDHDRAAQTSSKMESHAAIQLRGLEGELFMRTEELQQRNEHLRHRDQEMLDVSSQLTDLQGLFCEVNQQLQVQSDRVDKLQGAVGQCAKQSAELEQLTEMLQDSHNMLARVHSALEEERAERVRTGGLLQHEQQRTQLLLDVLKHFKEKLQGLTPQVLLGRLGWLDPKALAALDSNGTLPGIATTTAQSRPAGTSPASRLDASKGFPVSFTDSPKRPLLQAARVPSRGGHSPSVTMEAARVPSRTGHPQPVTMDNSAHIKEWWSPRGTAVPRAASAEPVHLHSTAPLTSSRSVDPAASFPPSSARGAAHPPAARGAAGRLVGGSSHIGAGQGPLPRPTSARRVLQTPERWGVIERE